MGERLLGALVGGLHAASQRGGAAHERHSAAREQDQSDAALLALLPEYARLKAEYDAYNASAEPWVEDSGAEFDDFCMKVVAMRPATTAAGRAFKAQMTPHQFVYIQGSGDCDTAIQTVLREVVAAGTTIP